MSQDQQIRVKNSIKAWVSPECDEMRRAGSKSRNSTDGFFQNPIEFFNSKNSTLNKNFANKWVIEKKLNSMAVIERLENE